MSKRYVVLFGEDAKGLFQMETVEVDDDGSRSAKTYSKARILEILDEKKPTEEDIRECIDMWFRENKEKTDGSA